MGRVALVLVCLCALAIEAVGIRRRADPLQLQGKADDLQSSDIEWPKSSDKATQVMVDKGKEHAMEAKKTQTKDKEKESTEPKPCPGTPACSDHGSCNDDGTCECEFGWKGDKCDKSSFPPGKKIPLEGSEWRVSVPPEILEECALTTNAKAGQCPADAISYRFLCARFVEAINDKALYRDCASSSVDKHMERCMQGKHIEAFASCPSLCAAILHRWCIMGAEQQAEKADIKSKK